MPQQQPNLWNGVYQSSQQPFYAGSVPGAAAPNPWIDLTQRLYSAETQLKQLTDQLALVQKQLDEVKSKPPMHIEYHFDQLKVNRLEGTLNVGIAPQGIKDIEALETPGFAGWKAAEEDEALQPLRQVQQEMAAYMDTESYSVLTKMESQFNVSLSEEHRAQVIADVKKQLGERVHYYVRSETYPAQGTEEEKRIWRDKIKNKTIRDVQGAFAAYLGRQQNSGKADDS